MPIAWEARGRRRQQRRRPIALVGVVAQLLSIVPAAAAAGLAVTGSFIPSIDSSLAAARALVAPKPQLDKGGEFEGYEFWEENDELLEGAWKELGPRHAALYVYGQDFEKRYLSRDLRNAVVAARGGQGEAAVRGLFSELVPGVYASDRIFTGGFLADMLEELEHIESSGIPCRRPNGMNRYGVILDNVGLEAALSGFVNAYLRPLAQTLFPELVGAEDAEEHYAFTVRYEATGDTELAQHGDASVVTLNLCLGRPGWQGGALRFFTYEGRGMYELPGGNNASAGAGDVNFRPGLALLHRGQHKHQALPLLSGERTNIIMWLFAKHGVVRVAPYPEKERLTASQRWLFPDHHTLKPDL